LTLALEQKYVPFSVENFGERVLPRFDRHAVHPTTRQHEAALGAQAA